MGSITWLWLLLWYLIPWLCADDWKWKCYKYDQMWKRKDRILSQSVAVMCWWWCGGGNGTVSEIWLWKLWCVSCFCFYLYFFLRLSSFKIIKLIIFLCSSSAGVFMKLLLFHNFSLFFQFFLLFSVVLCQCWRNCRHRSFVSLWMSIMNVLYWAEGSSET